MIGFFGADLKPYKLVCNHCGFKKIIYPKSTCCRGGDEFLYRNCPHCNAPTERKELGFLEEILISFKKDSPRPNCKSWKNSKRNK